MLNLSDFILNRLEIKVWGSPKFMEFYGALSKSSDLYKEIDNALDLLKEDPDRGDRIQRDRWPKCYVQAFNVQTLFRFELREGRRLIYTVYIKNEIGYCNILEIFSNHKEYDKRFGY